MEHYNDAGVPDRDLHGHANHWLPFVTAALARDQHLAVDFFRNHDNRHHTQVFHRHAQFTER